MRIAILGAGLAGVTTAWRLAADGHEVTLIERNAAAAGEASGANGGIVSASRAFPWANPQMLKTFLRALVRNDQAVRVFLLRWDPAFWAWGLRFLSYCRASEYAGLLATKVRFVRYAQAQLAQIATESGVPYHRGRGVLYVYRTAQALEAGVKKMEPMRAFGFPYRVVDAVEARVLDPGLAKSPIVGAIYSESDESGDSALFCRGLIEALERRGMQLRLGCEVRGLEVEGDRVVAVQTSTGRIEADAFVCALGVIEPHLLRQFGAHLPVYPVRGSSTTLPIVNLEAAPRLAGMDDLKLAAWCPMGDRLRLTGGAEFAGWGRDIDPAGFARLHALAEEMFPGATDARGAVNTVCRRPMTPQSLPLFGIARHRNLWFNVGLGHMGWTMASGGARITADLIAGRTPEIPLDGLLVRPA